jgi:hypothetical protein
MAADRVGRVVGGVIERLSDAAPPMR